MDYDDLLNETWGDLPTEKILPDGGWRLKGTNAAWVKPRTEGQKAKVLFSYEAQEPLTVDPDVIEEKLGAEYDLGLNNLTFTIFIESAKDWVQVKKHLAVHGIELENTDPLFDDNKKLAFAKAFRGTEVVAQIGHRFFESNGEQVEQNTLSKFQPVTE